MRQLAQGNALHCSISSCQGQSDTLLVHESQSMLIHCLLPIPWLLCLLWLSLKALFGPVPSSACSQLQVSNTGGLTTLTLNKCAMLPAC